MHSKTKELKAMKKDKSHLTKISVDEE